MVTVAVSWRLAAGIARSSLAQGDVHAFPFLFVHSLSRDGTVKAWDLETMCVVDTKLCSSEHEVLSLATGNANLFWSLSVIFPLALPSH